MTDFWPTRNADSPSAFCRFCVAVTSYAVTDGDSLAIVLIDNERIAVSESPHTSKANAAGR